MASCPKCGHRPIKKKNDERRCKLCGPILDPTK